MTLRQIIQFFVKYKYQAIFPIAVVEGPIITIISGFLVSRGQLELFPALFVVFFGDVVSDVGFYFIGKGGRKIIKYLRFLFVTEERLQRLENQFEVSPWKTMIVGKISYGLGSVFMVASGASKMSIQNFLEYIFSLDFVRSSLLLSIGYYFGKAALHFGSEYLERYAVAVIILVPATYIIYKKNSGKILRKKHD